MSKEKIKFAVVGCGHIGKRHATMISNNSESELVALCDVLPRNKLNLGDLGSVDLFSSLEDLLSSNLDFDVVNICTPNGLHSEQAILALDKNKHIVVEKPIGLSEGEKMTVGSGPIRNFILGGSDHSAYFQLALAARISRCYDVCVVEVCYGNNGLTVTGQFYT